MSGVCRCNIAWILSYKWRAIIVVAIEAEATSMKHRPGMKLRACPLLGLLFHNLDHVQSVMERYARLALIRAWNLRLACNRQCCVFPRSHQQWEEYHHLLPHLGGSKGIHSQDLFFDRATAVALDSVFSCFSFSLPSVPIFMLHHDRLYRHDPCLLLHHLFLLCLLVHHSLHALVRPLYHLFLLAADYVAAP